MTALEAPPSIEALQEELTLDFELFAETCLEVQSKSGGFVPFLLNRAQRVLHAAIEDQLHRTGRVRMLIPKARKLGASTYVGARFYWRTSRRQGVNALVMAHDDTASSNLFRMVDGFHRKSPARLRPSTGAANAKELNFAALGSSYFVRTAGGLEPGRSFTFHLLHASELAFWSNPERIKAGAVNAVPDADDTEIVMESTSDEPSDLWARDVQAALEGKSEFEVCFLGWYLDDEYRMDPPPDWRPSQAWRDYQGQHGLRLDQLYWAFVKNRPLARAYGQPDDAPCAAFKHEYPATVQECFEAAGDDMKRVIPLAWIRRAQQRWRELEGVDPGPMTSMGVDVAQGGAARSVIAPWYGYRLAPLIVLPGIETPDGASLSGLVVQHRRGRAQVIIDGGGGWGGDTFSHLKDQAVPVALWKPTEASAWRSERGDYAMASKKVEALWKLREALDPDFGLPVALPPDEEMVQDLTVYTFKLTHGATPAVQLCETKEDVVDALGRSPDRGDAVVLGWAMPAGAVDPEPARRPTLEGEGPGVKNVGGRHAAARAQWRKRR